MTQWPTHRARARQARQHRRWAKRQRQLERRKADRTKQQTMEARP